MIFSQCELCEDAVLDLGIMMKARDEVWVSFDGWLPSEVGVDEVLMVYSSGVYSREEWRTPVLFLVGQYNLTIPVVQALLAEFAQDWRLTNIHDPRHIKIFDHWVIRTYRMMRNPSGALAGCIGWKADVASAVLTRLRVIHTRTFMIPWVYDAEERRIVDPNFRLQSQEEILEWLLQSGDSLEP